VNLVLDLVLAVRGVESSGLLERSRRRRGITGLAEDETGAGAETEAREENGAA